MADQVGVNSRCLKSLDGLSYSKDGRNLKIWCDFEDFIGGFNGYGVKGSNFFGAWNAGVGSSIVDIAAWVDRPGIIGLTPAINALGYAWIRHGAAGGAALQLGAGAIYTFESEAFLSDFSTIAERFNLQAGFTANIAGASNEQAIFYYADNLSPNWLCINTHLGVQTITDSGIPIVCGVFVRLKVIMYGTTRTEFWINNVLVATHLANFPILTSIAPGMSIVRSAAAVVGPVWYIDWIWTHYDLAVSR